MATQNHPLAQALLALFTFLSHFGLHCQAAAFTKNVPNSTGTSPNPTIPPKLRAQPWMGNLDLLKRAAASSGGVLTAAASSGASSLAASSGGFHYDPVHTCGYLDGLASYAITCSQPYGCAVNTILGAAGCCDQYHWSDCILYSSCVPSAALGLCNTNCLTDNFILKCSDSASAYCGTLTWPLYFGYRPTQVFCAQSTSEIASMASFVGFHPPASFSTQSLPQITQTKVTTSVSVYVPSIPPKTVFITEQISPTATQSHGGSSTPVGAIAGGTVGGVAVLALAGVAIFYILKKKKNKPQPSTQETAASDYFKNAPTSPQAQDGYQYPAGSSPQAPPSYPGPAVTGYYGGAQAVSGGQMQQNQYMSPQHQYPSHVPGLVEADSGQTRQNPNLVPDAQSPSSYGQSPISPHTQAAGGYAHSPVQQAQEMPSPENRAAELPSPLPSPPA